MQNLVQERHGGDALDAFLANRAPLPKAEAVTWAMDSILFSACNEDTRSELRALRSIEGKRVLCVTAGGGRVLSLLAGRPKEVCAVDCNPTQNHLLELKIAAMRELDHDGYLRFLGVRASPRRLATYERVRRHLSMSAARFFDDRHPLVSGGVLFQGKLERFFSRLSPVLNLVQPAGLSTLFACDDLAEQRRCLSRWESPVWRAVARNASRRSVIRLFSGDPGFYRYVPGHVAVHHAVYDAVYRHLYNNLARDNPLLHLVFFGRYMREAALPLYLNAAHYEQIKAALAEVHIERVTSAASAVLEQSPQRFDAFSLSDISSYLNEDGHARLFEAVLRAARPSARLCSRSNLHHRALSGEHAHRVLRDEPLERELASADHACVHEFLVGEIP